MATTGRNDPCVCGSGKKYKKCCLNGHSGVRAPRVPDFAHSPLVEGEAFAQLLAESDAFSKFYGEMRPQLADFSVVHDPNLPEGVRARITRTESGRYLRIRTRVCSVDQAHVIAHELGHLLLDQRGFPVVGGVNDHQAAASLNSAFHDPLVDSMLREYGLECAEGRRADVKEAYRQLGSILKAPSDQAGRAHWIANCLGHHLDQHVLGDEPSVSAFLEWVARRYPSIGADAKKLAVEVVELGFSTPETMMVALGHARDSLRAGGGVISRPLPLK